MSLISEFLIKSNILILLLISFINLSSDESSIAIDGEEAFLFEDLNFLIAFFLDLNLFTISVYTSYNVMSINNTELIIAKVI